MHQGPGDFTRPTWQLPILNGKMPMMNMFRLQLTYILNGRITGARIRTGSLNLLCIQC